MYLLQHLSVKTIKSTIIIHKNYGNFVYSDTGVKSINEERLNGGDDIFPSGHTSAVFTGAAFLYKRYVYKVGVPAYLLASFVGWSRGNTNKHDYQDTLGGIIIEYISAYIFAKPINKKDEIEISRIGNTNTFSLHLNL